MSEVLVERPWYARLAWIGVLVGGVVAYLVVLTALVTTQNANFFPTLLLIGALTAPLSVLLLATGGREQVVSPGTVAWTAIAGGFIGILTAGVVEYDTLKTLTPFTMLLVGIIEEASKLIVPVLVLLFSRSVRDVRAGVIIGVASGMGFAVLETMGYGFSVLLQAQSLAAVDATLLLRGLLAPASHVAWTGLTAHALWHWRFGNQSGRGALGFVGAYVLAVLLHALWDGSSLLFVHVCVVVVSVTILVVLIHRSHRPTSAPALA